MEKYKIKYIPQPLDDNSNSASELKTDIGIKESFWDNNVSMSVCIDMILNKDIEETKKKNPHYALYGKYLGGFLFESFDLLPPLCILNIVLNNKPHNSVYYNHMIYDPKLGIFAADDYNKNGIHILTYIQMFIEEAYQGLDRSPIIPKEIHDELEKRTELRNYFRGLPSMQQSKILNYIYPFSKASSLNEKRKISQCLKSKQVDSIIGHIKVMYRDLSDKLKKLHSYIKDGGILSIALYNEIESKPDPDKKLSPKGLISTITISHEEAIKPYIDLIESCGFILNNIVENGGVHFDNFHSPYHWKKYGEVRISSLERRLIYNFIKI
ncbi:MAG: hypothetical protein ACYCWE_17745 [Eubacteriales bacterium]